MVKRKYFLVFVLGICIMVLDLISKWIIHSFNINFSILPFLNIFPVTNTGAAFSILQDSTLLLIFISLIIIGFILFYLDKIENRYAIGVGLILGGAFGNLVDRIFLGYVRDFISVSIFPVFNIADSAVVIGVLLCIIASFKDSRNEGAC